MFAKTVCKPGSHICIVPIGLRSTLQYNANGVIEKIFSGYGDSKINVSESILNSVKKSKLIPNSIPTKGGTTWVEGVLYTDKIFTTPGVLPECIEGDLIKDIISNPSDYSFYAGRVESLAASFRSVVTIRNWISMSGFNSLPIFLIPSRLTNEAFIQLVDNERFPFQFPLISGYMIFEGTEFRYHPLCLNQYVVKSVKREVDEKGYIKACITDKEGNVHIYQHSEASYNAVQKGTLVVCKKDGRLIYSSTKSSAPKVIKVTCEVCGNTFECPKSGPVCCTDINCMSNMYPRVSRFMATLDLPVITYEQFKTYVSKKQLTCFTDVLLLPEYKDIKITCNLPKFLQAVVPADICSDATLFSKLASTCNNSLKTFTYYLSSPSRLKCDIGATTIMTNRLINWISEPENALTFTTLFDSDQVCIKETDKKFEGAPIFRGKKLAITGKFKHGDYSDIISILKSYSADVEVGIDVFADCLIVGDFRENIDGKSLQIARENDIPTFFESEFFAKYQIDDDITANLL